VSGRAPNRSTSAVVLRDVTDEDLPIFFEDQLDPEGAQMAAFASRDREAFTAHWARLLGDETVITKTIVFDGEVAGNVVSFEHAGRREVGYWIGPRFWGRGVATAALSAFLAHDTTRPLYAGVAEHNTASIRVLEKCGFTVADDARRDPDEHRDGVEFLLLELRA
jgi:RimJ/RimL family protein N-acetyltransferase